MRLDHITPKQFVMFGNTFTSLFDILLMHFQFRLSAQKVLRQSVLPGGHSECEPPDSIPNSEVKPLSADDSMGFPHVKVGHCQASISGPCMISCRGLCFCSMIHIVIPIADKFSILMSGLNIVHHELIYRRRVI